MTTPVAHKVCESTAKFFRDITTPPTSRPSPARKPMATRSSGGTRLLSNEYLTKNATPRNNAKPPSQAKPLTPMNCSQLIFDAGSDTGSRATFTRGNPSGVTSFGVAGAGGEVGSPIMIGSGGGAFGGRRGGGTGAGAASAFVISR